MDIQTLPPKHPTTDYGSNVDTSSPFRSVKEAVAIFGERFLTPETYTPKTFSFPKQGSIENSRTIFSPSPQKENLSEEEAMKLEVTLKRLESELEETKKELKLLKEKELETEVALALLNAELHMNISKMAQAEAAVAAKAANRGPLVFGRRESGGKEEESRRDLTMKMERKPSLAEILGEKEGFYGRGNGRKMMKKKPIIPLLGDLFSRRKRSTYGIHNSLYSSSFLQWN